MAFQSLCLLCQEPAGKTIALCSDCETLLPKTGQACYQCGLPLLRGSDEPIRCGTCLKNPPAFDHTVSAFLYAWPVNSFLLRFKCSAKFSTGAALTTSLDKTLSTLYSHETTPQAMIPVPLHPKRLRQRGFNQAMEVAKGLKRRLGIPILHRAVDRHRHTEAQRTLTKGKRRHNTANAFTLCKPIMQDRIAIVDDVMTTGETANALACCLKQAGVREVTVWCIARTARE